MGILVWLIKLEINNRHSSKIQRDLIISYKDHPHIDSIPLTGEVFFPNLKFETQQLNFGCILNSTSKKISVNVTNEGPTKVNYRWAFVAKGTEQDTYINRVFDILPIHGSLESGATEKMEITFNASVGKHYR